MDNESMVIFLAVYMVKHNKTFNEFMEEEIIKHSDIPEYELRTIWNEAWFSVGMSKRVMQKVLENWEAEHGNN